MREPQKIVVLTGAGISAESGVPTFRGSDGLWHSRRIEDVATDAAIARDPWGVNAFFNGLRTFIHDIKPNPAHTALVKLERFWGDDFLLVTQNVDPLHDLAGSKNLIHMHGELLRIACDECGKDYPFNGDVFKETICEKCGVSACLRPDIVLFGEMPKQMDRIQRALMECDLFIAIGTSGAVYPAAGFVDIANHVGAHAVEINTAETQRSSAFKEHITGPAGQAVPDYVERLCSLRQRPLDLAYI